MIRCPKRKFLDCIGEDCGWWIPLRGSDGEELGRCSVQHTAISLDIMADVLRKEFVLGGDGDENEDRLPENLN